MSSSPRGYRDNSGNCVCCLTCVNGEADYDWDFTCKRYEVIVDIIHVCDDHEFRED